MTPAGIEPATFRFLAQHPNHCVTAVPDIVQVPGLNLVLIKMSRPMAPFCAFVGFYVNT